MSRPTPLVLGAAAVLALGLTACGGGGGGGTGSGNDVEGKTIEVGVSAPLTGPAATAGTATVCGVRAALQDADVNGYSFEVSSKDNQFDPGISASVARDFSTDGAFAVVIAGSGPLEASTPVLKGRGIPVFGSPDGAIVSPPSWEGIFGYNAVYANEGASAADFVVEQLKQNEASAVYLAPAGESAGTSFKKALEAAGGKVPANEALAPDVTDFAGVAQKLQRAGAPVVYAPLVDTQLAGLQKAADAIGYDPIWVSWPIAQGPTYVELAGKLSEDVYFAQWAQPETQTDLPEVKEYVEAISKVKDCEEAAGDSSAKSGYALGKVILHGIDLITADDAKPTSKALIEALAEVEDQQFGLTPHMAYDDASHAGVRQNSWWQVKDGQLVLVRDFEPLPNS